MYMSSRPAELLTAVAGAILFLVMSFGVNVTDDQAAAIVGVVALIPACVTAFVELTRRR